MAVTRFFPIWAAKIMRSATLPWSPIQPATETQPSVMTPCFPATPVVRTSLWVTRLGPPSLLAVTIYVSVLAQAAVSSTGLSIIAIGTAAAGVFANFGPTTFIGGINEPTGDPGSTVAVMIDSNNNLGTSPSSRRFKHDIKPMDKASGALLSLKPVSFKYNHDVKGSTQYGLVAEEVAQVDPHLVVYHDGQPFTVKYDQINVMLLNEFLKEHKKVEEQQASISQLKGEMQTMVAQLKDQAAQIQKVSAQLEVNKPAPKVVVNKP